MATIDPRRNANQSFDLEGRIPITTKDTPIGNVAPHPVTLSFLEWVYKEEAAHAANIVQLREYYDGKQESLLTDRQRSYLQVGDDITFRLNAMAIPVDTQAERLKVIGFDVIGDDLKENPQAGEDGFLWRVWQQNRMDATQLQVHKSAAKDGDTYAIVGWDDVKKYPTIHHELAWDGSNGVVVRYRPDDKKKIWYAAKRWTVDHGLDAGKKVFLTIYTDDAIANFVGNTGGMNWEPLPGETGQHIHPWVKADGITPLGVPVFHAENNGDGTGFGKSELEDLLSLQNVLDKVVVDELGTADFSGFPIPWATGMKVGDVIFSPGMIMSSQDHKVRFGLLQATNLVQASELVRAWILRIAQASRTPLQFFQITGQTARAETQKAGDSPLVSKVKSRARGMGNFWEDVFGMARQLHNEFGKGVTYEELIISTAWDSFETIDVQEEAKQTAETAELKATTFSQLLEDNPNADRAKLAEMAGYSPDEALVLATPSTGFRDDGLTQ